RLAEESVQTRAAAGVISERQAREELLAIYSRQREAIQGLIPALQEQAAATGVAADIELLQSYALELEKLNLLIQQTGDAWRQVRERVADAITSDISDFLSRGVDEVRSAGEALVTILRDMLQSVREIVAQMLSEQLVRGVRQLLSRGSGGGDDAARETQTAAVALTAAGGVVASSAGAVTTSAAALSAAGGVITAAASAIASSAAALAAAAAAASAANGLSLGFAGGGYTGHGGRYEPAGIVHRGEY